MPLILPGQALLPGMDTETSNRLGAELGERLDSLKEEHAPLLRAIAVWWKWYHAVPKEKVKNFPFANASNVVVPIIGITCDALTSRALAQATAAAPTYWSTRTENESRSAPARNMARFINWQADGNCFSLKDTLSRVFPEMHVTGRSVVGLHYTREVRPMWFGQGNGRPPQLAPVTFGRGPRAGHISREHILWDTRFRIGDAPFVARYHEWAWTELRDMAKQDPETWDRAAIEAVKGNPGPDEFTESRRIEQVKDEIALRDADAAGLESKVHGVWEIHADWSLLSNRFEIPGEEAWGGTQVPLVVHLHARTRRVLRLTGSPYLLPYKPFVDLRWRHGNHGVAKALEQMQAMMTTSVNQAFDAQTRANALWGATRNPKHTRQPIDPSRWFLVDAMDEITPLNFNQPLQPNIALMQVLQTITERWMGASDPLMGRETRSGGHPAPATSTLALLEQVNVMSAGTDVMLQEELSRLGEAIAVLNQQFEDNSDGRLQQILGMEDAASVGEFLFPAEPIPGNYFFDVVALSRTENPDSRMRRSLMVAQAYQNYGALAAQAAQVLDMPANKVGPRVKAVWTKLLDAYGSLLAEFLDSANIDDGERYLVQLDQLGIDARGSFAQFSREAAAAAGGGAAPGSAGPVSAGGPVGSAGNGAASGAGLPGAGLGLL